MPSVKVYNDQFDKAFRKFKKAVSNAGILEELRAREGYEKPSLARKRKLGAAKARYRKKVRQEKQAFEPSRWPQS